VAPGRNSFNTALLLFSHHCNRHCNHHQHRQHHHHWSFSSSCSVVIYQSEADQLCGMQAAPAGPASTLSQSVQRPTVAASTPANFIIHTPVVPPTVAMPPGTVAPPTVAVPPSGTGPPSTVQSSAPTKFDLLADFGSDPFAPPTKSAAGSSK